MIPKTVSASALNVWTTCKARFHAEYVLRARGFQNDAATQGSCIHTTLEHFVQEVVFKRKMAATLENLLELFHLHWLEYFKHDNEDDPRYISSVEMLEKWFKNNSNIFSDEDRAIVSTEEKETFEVKVMIDEVKTPIPFTFIMDRLDMVGENQFEVVDYKTSVKNISVEELISKIQSRAYALAVQIKYPHAEKIWVTFDMLRYGPVGVSYSKEDNRKTYYELVRIVQEIIDTAEPVAEFDPQTGDMISTGYESLETLNGECVFCVRKAECSALKRNYNAGGIASLEIDEAVDLRTDIANQVSGLNSLIKELNQLIEPVFAEADGDMIEYSTGKSKAFYPKPRGMRKVDASMVKMAVGDKIFAQYGEEVISMGQFDKLLKDRRLEPEHVHQLKSLVSKEYSTPELKFQPLGALDDL
jgi:RecB family exonuclease